MSRCAASATRHRTARSVLAKGETRTFELVSLDAARRRAELALPGIGDSATA